jgi:outer membrane protein OmpA-like peptidoglycan-associated protein
MFRRPSSFAAALATAVSLEALLLAGPVLAQNVQIFEETPSIEELRKILIPETTPGGASRRIEIPRRDAIGPAPMVRPAALEEDRAEPAPSAPPQAAPPQSPPPAAVEAPARPAPRETRATAALPSSAMAAAPARSDAPNSGTADAVGFRINFALNSVVVPPAYEPYIDRMGELMQQEPSLVLLVEGHTDALGSDEYNVRLSERRAVAVARYLVVRHGVAPERLRVAGRGKSEPLMEDRYDPRNRRVQFLRVE